MIRALKNCRQLHARARRLLPPDARKSEIPKASCENADLDRRILPGPPFQVRQDAPHHSFRSRYGTLRSLPRGKTPWPLPWRAGNKPFSDPFVFWNRLLLEPGLPDVRIPYEVQKMPGHADPRTTMRYAHLEQHIFIGSVWARKEKTAELEPPVRRADEEEPERRGKEAGILGE